MKLVVLTSYVSRRAGGLFNSVRRLLQTQVSLPGVDASVLSVVDEFTLTDLAAWRPLVPEVFPARGPASLRFAPELRDRLEALNPDLVRVDGIWDYPSAVAGRWSRRTRRPGIVAPRGMLDEWALRQWRVKKFVLGRLYEHAHLHGAACLHALCEPELRACRAFGLRNPVAVIPNGIDVPVPGSCAPLRLPEAAGRNVLLYLGRLHPKKGLPNLLTAWASLNLPQPSPWVLALAGWDQDGHEAQLHRQATELGLRWSNAAAKSPAPVEPSVVFLGPRFEAEKDAAYARADAFILPSFSEGLPMVILEAWAHAKPVVMTSECNLPAGFEAAAALQIETAPESIAAGLRLLMEMSDAERSAMGGRGKALVAAKFTWPRVAAQMHEVCQWVLGGGPRPFCVVTE
jgi:glycosyltransferase involved in cell wall biosynthesis